ncbi:MAG: class I SAM-dependent methyltransferase [Myxococcota bacterium]
MSDWRTLNRKHWDERVPLHVQSAFYDVAGWRAGRDSLQPFEVEEVGDVAGSSLVHLQCHFGLDTLSWARRGARVTGVDFSGEAVAAARSLAAASGLAARFVEADVYDAPTALGTTYDIVYTSHGVLSWLPDLDGWAAVVAALLRPGGFLYLSEFHPLSWCLDQGAPTPQLGRDPEHDYFVAEPLAFADPGSYADRGARTACDATIEHQHRLGQVVTALCARGFALDFLRERDWTLYPQFPWLRREGDRYVQPGARVPLLYSLRARR